MNEELRQVQSELKRMKAIQPRVSDFVAYNRKLVELTKRNNFLVEEGRKERRDRDLASEEKAKIKDYFGTDPRLRDKWGR